MSSQRRQIPTESVVIIGPNMPMSDAGRINLTHRLTMTRRDCQSGNETGTPWQSFPKTCQCQCQNAGRFDLTEKVDNAKTTPISGKPDGGELSVHESFHAPVLQRDIHFGAILLRIECFVENLLDAYDLRSDLTLSQRCWI